MRFHTYVLMQHNERKSRGDYRQKKAEEGAPLKNFKMKKNVDFFWAAAPVGMMT